MTLSEDLSSNCQGTNVIFNQNQSLHWSFKTGKLDETSRKHHTLRAVCSDVSVQFAVCRSITVEASGGKDLRG